MQRRRGLLIALAVAVGSTSAACKAPDKLSSFTTTTRPTKVLNQAFARTDASIPPPTRVSLAAIATGPSVTVRPEPGSSAVTKVFSNPTIENMQLAMFVVEQQGDWLQVRLPMRPNGAMGWIEAREVQLEQRDNRVVISLAQRSVRVLNKDQQTIYETNAAVGKPRTPTPLGRFYVDVWLPNPGSPYGTFLLSVSGFSDVLKTFGGGQGQIALHGWSDASVMGRDVSNGCIRMRNADIVKLSELAPLGTPVEIIA